MTIKRFTGWHMTAILVAGFGVVIAVNVMMARYAVSTFGGTVVENGYVASQRYNGWLAEARAQDRAGWTLETGARNGRVTLLLARAGKPVGDARLTVTAAHPLGRVPERTIAFSRSADGSYHADTPLPAGRWRLHIGIASPQGEARFERDVRG